MSNTVTKIGKTNFLGAQIDEKVTKEKINEIIDEVNSIKPYKVYVATLTQSGTDAPTATVLENTLGLNPTYYYNAPGSYYLEDLAGLFASNKTAVFMQFKNGGPAMEIWVENINEIDIGTDGQNDVLLNTFLEIRVYN